jgi:F-type H+-transporting ATPase subunit gamma
LGLCGAYNINACKHLLSKIAPEDDIATIGKKGYAYLKARNYINRIVSVNEVSDVNIDYMEILPTSDLAIKHFNDGKYKQIHLIYTKFINALTFEPTSIQLLPLDVNLFKPQTTQQKSRYVSLTTDLKEIEYEPSKLAIIKSALPTFVSSAIFAAVTESKVCESGSRRNAMEAASDNAKQLISDLTLQYNRARQENITQEINEIVAGAGELG